MRCLILISFSFPLFLESMRVHRFPADSFQYLLSPLFRVGFVVPRNGSPLLKLCVCETHTCIALLHQLLFIVFRKSSLLNNFAYGFKTGCIARRARSVFAKSHIYALDRGDSNVLKLGMQWTNFAVHNEQFLCSCGWNVKRKLQRTDSTWKRKPFIKFKFHIAKEIVKLIQLKLWRFSKVYRVDGRASAHAREKCTPYINTRVLCDNSLFLFRFWIG